MPSYKILMGLPMYGRGWQGLLMRFLFQESNHFFSGVTNTSLNGFSQKTSNQLPKGTWEDGVFDYSDLKGILSSIVINDIGMNNQKCHIYSMSRMVFGSVMTTWNQLMSRMIILNKNN